MPFIVITRDQNFEREWEFDGLEVVSIGRAATNDIVLADEAAQVSRFHACIVRRNDGERYFLRDLSSLHSTKVKGSPIIQHDLSNGDVIGIGPYQLIYTEGTSDNPNLTGGEEDLLSIVDQDDPAGSSDALRRAQGWTTKPIKGSRLTEGGTLSEAQQELFAEFLKKVQGASELPSIFGSGLEDIARVFEGTSALAGLFAHDTAKGYRTVGVYGLDPQRGERLRVTKRTFLEDLRGGTPVVEANVVMAPVYAQNCVTGFLCVAWKGRTAPISKSEVDVLCMLGRMTSVVGTQGRQADPPRQLARPWPSGLVGRSDLAQALRKELVAAAETEENVLFYGPTGSGKEVAATTVHRLSHYSRGPFIAYSCSTLQETLAESELFGYVPKSGITGGDPQGKPGLFELAAGGILFLDEIHTLSLPLQAKLLRVLAEKEVWRIGGKVPVQVRAKVMAATNEDLDRAMGRATFRTDLYFRFGRRVRIPSLAERAEDLPLLVHYFLDQCGAEQHRQPVAVSRQTIQSLTAHKWPGNIRELRDYVKQAALSKQDVWFSWDLPAAIKGASGTEHESIEQPKSMKEVERAHILEALAFTRGNKTEAAKILGFQSRQTLLNKMDEYQIPRAYGGKLEDGTGVTA